MYLPTAHLRRESGLKQHATTYTDLEGSLEVTPENSVFTDVVDVVYIHCCRNVLLVDNPYPTAFPYGNGMVLHFYQQQDSSTTKTVHKVINKGLKAYV